MTQDEVEVTLKLPNRVIDFIAFLCTLKGQTREEAFMVESVRAFWVLSLGNG